MKKDPTAKWGEKECIYCFLNKIIDSQLNDGLRFIYKLLGTPLRSGPAGKMIALTKSAPIRGADIEKDLRINHLDYYLKGKKPPKSLVVASQKWFFLVVLW